MALPLFKEEKEAAAGEAKKGKGKKKRKKKKATAAAASASAAATTMAADNKNNASGGGDALAQSHLMKSLKSTNPNYRIQRELKAFMKDPPKHLTVRVGKNLRVWAVTVDGTPGSVYEGETFLLRIAFPKSYPTVPPSVYFLSNNKYKIPVHEHVYTNGDICLSLLGKDWRPTMTAQSIAVSILSILSSATHKELPMDNAAHAGNAPGQYQKDWVYHDDNCKYLFRILAYPSRVVFAWSHILIRTHIHVRSFLFFNNMKIATG